MDTKNKMIKLIFPTCLECGKTIRNSKFCSILCACRNRNRKNQINGNLVKWGQETASTPDWINRMSKYWINPPFEGHKHTEEAKELVSIANTGRIESEEQKKQQSDMMKYLHSIGFFKLSPEANIEKGRKISIAKKGKNLSESTKVKIREKWKSQEFINNISESRNKRPNKSELRLQNILNTFYPGQWTYVGDGKLKIGCKCPDFINKDNKTLLELFGNYWHREDPTNRLNFFKRAGFDCVIIWGSELNDTNIIKSKIDFVLRRNN